MRLSRDPFSIHGSHGIAQGLEMPGKFLLENQQEVTYEFAVIFDARQQFSEINHRIWYVLSPLSSRDIHARWGCAPGEVVKARGETVVGPGAAAPGNEAPVR